MGGYVGITFELGQIQFTEYDDRDVLRAQPDGLGEAPRVGSKQLHHTLGFTARALDPDTDSDGKIIEGSGGLALIGKDGIERFIVPLGDPRNLAKLPILKKGEAMMYGPAGNFARCHADGSVSVFTTTDGTLDGKSVFFQVRPDGFVLVAPWGKLTFDDEGFHMLHSSGARMEAGAIGGLPDPLTDLIGSYFKIGAASVEIDAALTTIGAAGGVPDSAAKSTPVIAALAAIGSALSAIQAALVAIPPGLTEPAKTAAAGLVTTAGGFVVPAAAACAASAAAVPSSTTVT
jgi:hypothetical protein